MKTKYIDIHTHNPRADVLSPTMAGIHPWRAEEGAELPDFSHCDIVGETGLDYACKVDRELQKRLFIVHIEGAIKAGKPIVLHTVRTTEEVLKILSGYKAIRGVIFHGFIGSWQQAQRCIERGYYLSFGERSLRSSKTREVIAKMPQNLLFCETDDNTDIAIEEIYKSVAEIRGTTPEELLRTIEDNYKNLFP
ncbi:MAG: TatD family hydrolase [Alistipes sp.]|nr:TatD family hydrolase [Alistipes sp.]